ncbi:hypothetical protein F7731_09595 [Cytobacillus depressus]|uniref:Uncharacterized protein n=1 Tax=Cytobacillus depressus TaxID=1602942 RepID=A0A6L3V611_9BACI|nr:hypothetical protein [Cytobacillus depressus]KAB2336608.1 hypothetical protein F7731_09595 [Cytobacillus depressus]
MKKVIFLIMVVIFSFTVYLPNANAKLTEEYIIKTVTNDFVDTHKVNLDGFEFLHNKEIAWNRTGLTIQQKSLSKIFRNIHYEQIIGDFAPLFYLNEEKKKGYVLEKKLSGSNNIYILNFDDTTQNWKITNKIEGMGKDLVELGLLKGAE